jgi:hypothetical protein
MEVEEEKLGGGRLWDGRRGIWMLKVPVTETSSVERWKAGKVQYF